MGWIGRDRRSLSQPCLPGRCSKIRVASARRAAGRRCRSWSNAKDASRPPRPAYLKSHSQGEYVFDHGWAEAWERAGGHYYPKLQIAVPFTPCVRAAAARRRSQRAARRARDGDGAERPVVGPHHLRRRGGSRRRPKPAAGCVRDGLQFHWLNRGYVKLRRFPRRTVEPQAQVDPQGTGRGGRGAGDP